MARLGRRQPFRPKLAPAIVGAAAPSFLAARGLGCNLLYFDGAVMLKKNTASQNLTFCLVNASTGAALTSASVTAYRCIDGAAQASATGSVTELANGQYKFAPSQADTNGDLIGYLFTATSAVPVNMHVRTTAADLSDSVRLGLTALPNAAAGASTGLLISGTNSGTTTLGALTVSGATTLAALSCTTLTASGAVAFQSTFAVTTSTSLGAFSCTTLTASGAVAFQSTFAVTTSTSLAALSCTTLTASGAVAFQSTFATTGTTTLNALTVTNATTLSGAVSFGSTWGVTGAVTFTAGLTSNITGTLTTVTTAVNVTTVNGLAAGVITAASIAADAITDAKVAADVTIASVTGSVGSVAGNVGGIAGTTQTLDALQTALSSAHGSGSWATAVGFSTLDAVGVRTAVGLATANLDTQLGAIAGYVDTEMAAVKLVADHLATALELSAGNYRFTTAALALGPGGGTGLTAQQTRDALKLAPTAGTPVDGSIDAELDAVLNLLNPAPTLTISSPVAPDGLVSLVRGDDYLIADSRSISLLNVTTALDLSAALTLWEIFSDYPNRSAVALLAVTCSAAVITGGYSLSAELTAAQTAILTRHLYRVRSILADGHVVTWQPGGEVTAR